MLRGSVVWLTSLTALLACAIFVVHLEGETADEVITETAWLTPEVKAKVEADRVGREVAAAEARAKAEVALEIMKKATQNALGLAPHLSIATIGLPAPSETATTVTKQAPPPPKKVKPAQKPHEAKQPPAKEKKKKPRVDLSALAHAAFGMIGDDATDDDGPETSMAERKAALQAEDDLGVADHLDHFTHEQEKLGRVRASQAAIASSKEPVPVVSRALGSKDLAALFDSHVRKAKKAAVPKSKQHKVKKLSAAQRRAIELKKRRVQEAKQHAADQKVDLLRQATQKWTHRVTRVQAPPPPPAPRKVEVVPPAECHPPECLPSGIETKRKHKRHAHHTKRHHSDEMVPEALTIESFDEHIERDRAARAEAARHKRHVAKAKHERDVHRERRRKKHQREAGEKVEREKAAQKHDAQKKAREQALEDISHSTDKYWVKHGAGWTRKDGNVVPTTKRLKEALKQATKMHLAENVMKAALEKAADTAAHRAEKESMPKAAHYHMSKQELMHHLLHQDVQLVHEKRHRQQAAREAAVQEARAARKAAKQSAKRARQAKAKAATTSTQQALQALAAKHAKKSRKRAHAAVDRHATSEQDLIKMLAQEDLKGGH